MKIYIKNMVCQGTRKFVMMEIKRLGLKLISFDSGELEFFGELSAMETCALESSLNKYGLKMSLQNDNSGSLFTFYDPVGLLMEEEDFYENGSMEMSELTQAN